MKFTITLTLTLLTFLQLFGQERINVPGTRLSIIPPTKDVFIADYFTVISGMTYEMTVLEFSETSPSTKELQEIDSAKYVSLGAEVMEEFEIQVDGYNATVLRMRSNSESDGVQIIFGDSTFLTTVTTLFVKDDTELFNAIVKSYKSIKFDKTKEIDWLKYLTITPNLDNQFKFIDDNFFSLRLFFTREGKSITNTYEQSSIMIHQLPNMGNTSTEKASSEIIGLYLKAGVEIISASKDGKFMIDGKPSYQVDAICKKDGKEFRFTSITVIQAEYVVSVLALAFGEEDISEIEKFLAEMTFK